MAPAQYVTQDFMGTVFLKDWLRWHDGRSYIGLVGKISIIQDEALVGFRTKGGESNWVARIEGPSEDAVVILGCQVRGCYVGEPSELAQDYLAVR